MSKKSLFDILKDITYTKAEYDSENTYSQYMVNRFVSMSEAFIPLVNELNKSGIPDKAHYNYLKIVLPKRQQYFKYIGKVKEDNDYSELIGYISKYFKISMKDAKQYYEFLKPEDRDTFRKIYNPEYNKSALSKKTKK